MAVPLRFYAYRITAARFRLAVSAVLTAMGGLFIHTGLDQGMSIAGRSWAVLAGAAMCALMLIRARRSATITSRDGIIIQGLLRTRRFAWRDVRDIRVEPSPGPGTARFAPKKAAVLYGRRGKRTILPYLNDVTLADRGLSLHAEVEHMRGLWQQLRGEDWVAAPGAGRTAASHAKTAGRARYPAIFWLAGFICPFAAAPLAVLLTMIGLLSGADGSLGPRWSWLFSPVWLPLPVLVFVMATAAAAVANRRSLWRRGRDAGKLAPCEPALPSSGGAAGKAVAGSRAAHTQERPPGSGGRS